MTQFSSCKTLIPAGASFFGADMLCRCCVKIENCPLRGNYPYLEGHGSVFHLAPPEKQPKKCTCLGATSVGLKFKEPGRIHANILAHQLHSLPKNFDPLGAFHSGRAFTRTRCTLAPLQGCRYFFALNGQTFPGMAS